MAAFADSGVLVAGSEVREVVASQDKGDGSAGLRMKREESVRRRRDVHRR